VFFGLDWGAPRILAVHMRCLHHNGSECTSPKGRELYGPRPSEGVCFQACVHRVSDDPPLIQVSVPEPPKPSLLRKAVSWAQAELSKVVEGPVGGTALEARLNACRICPALNTQGASGGQLGWCTKCGCKQGGSRSELTVKATMPKATCPLGRWPVDTKDG
jgi:hypothetical protein